jgi:hypothetical protein
MKVLSSPQTSKIRLSYEQALEHIKEIYKRCTVESDETCISKIVVEFDGKIIKDVFAEYNKIKIIPDNQSPIYWPIQPHNEKLDTENGMEILKRKTNAT